jgi:hypothetical protein
VSNPRPTGDRLLELLTSGELHQTARTCRTRGELARAIGMTDIAYEKARGRLVVAGHAFPGFNDLRAGINPCDSRSSLPAYRDPDTDIENSINAPVPSWEEVTKPHIAPVVGKWPSVEAFDAGEQSPPLPAIGKGFRVRKLSTLVDAVTGESKLQWIKVDAVDDVRQQWLDAIREVCAETPTFEPVDAPTFSDDDLLAVYPVGDPHVGLMAWHEDAGENFDLKIAERNLVAAFQHLIALAPASREALIILIGDNTHSDGQSNTTTKGTRVDVDGRTIKMMRTIVRAARAAIALALAKHGTLAVIVERGNHDELLSAMLALALSLLYENEPRVTIDVSPEMFHWYRFGANLIGTHHGDKAKPMDLLGVMAVDRKQDWGETTHRRFYCGHLHHLQTKEVPGVVIETLPTLASSDAWHRSMGYRSSRAMYMDVFHREFGHVNRHIVGIQQLTKKAA